MKRIILLIAGILAVTLLFSQNTFQREFLSFNKSNTSEEETEPIRTVVSGLTDHFDTGYSFSGIWITPQEVEGTLYNFIHIEGFNQTGETGKPSLPAHTDIIALPGAGQAKIRILDYEVQTFRGYRIHPVLQPALDTAGSPEPEFEIDLAAYNTDSFYPENIVEIIDVQELRGIPLAFVQMRPVQYNPVTGELKVYTSINYRVEFSGTGRSYEPIAEINSKHYTNVIKNYVLNNRNIPSGIENTNSREDRRDYIIITHSEYDTAANQLADWKRQLGYSVEVVSQASWTSSQVKTAISSRYAAWTPKPDYFVIIGDHTGSYAVPGEILSIGSDTFASDLYYACMDGTGDYVPDMAHGRISVSSASEAATVIQKIVNYEEDPPTNTQFYTTGLNCAYFQHAGGGYAERRFAQTTEEIRDYIVNDLGYNATRIYYTQPSVSPLYWNNGYYSNGEPVPTYLRRPNFAWDGDSNDIINGINAGSFYVLHRDHGYVGGSGWAEPYFTVNQIDLLSNGEDLPVVFSINCHTGEYQLSNCFAEKFLRKSNGGAVGVFAAAYYSISGYNDALAMGFFDAIWADPGFFPNFTGSGHSSSTPVPHSSMYTMGDVLNQGKIRMVEAWGDNWGYERYEHELFHYFGDPAMKIWTAQPTQITAAHPATLQVGDTSLSVTGCNVSDALATLVFQGELIGEVELSGGSGTITFDALTNQGTAVVTVSKHNYIPYQGNVDVLNTNPPIINVSPNSFTESLPTNQTSSQIMYITNVGDPASVLNYTITHEYVGSLDNLNDNISGSTFESSISDYLPGQTYDILFTIYNASDDNEWLSEATLDFPVGVTVNSSTNFDGPSGDLTTDGSTGNGALISWYDANGGYGNIYPGESANSTVNITVDSGFSGDMVLAWSLQGDIWGSTPHYITGSITITQSLSWLSINPISGSCVYNETDNITLSFDTSGMVDGTYYAEITITHNAGAPEIIPVTLNVGGVNHAPTIVLPDDFTFAEDGSLIVDFDPFVYDEDGDPLALSVSGNTNVTVGISGLFVTFGNIQDWFGTENVTFTVDDGQTDATASDNVDIIVTPVNDPPILNITGTFEADEDLPSQTYDFSGYCSQTWG
jgi:hypothetical protein